MFNNNLDTLIKRLGGWDEELKQFTGWSIDYVDTIDYELKKYPGLEFVNTTYNTDSNIINRCICEVQIHNRIYIVNSKYTKFAIIGNVCDRWFKDVNGDKAIKDMKDKMIGINPCKICNKMMRKESAHDGEAHHRCRNGQAKRDEKKNKELNIAKNTVIMFGKYKFKTFQRAYDEDGCKFISYLKWILSKPDFKCSDNIKHCILLLYLEWSN